MRNMLLGLLAVPMLLSAESVGKPEKLSIHTWVREDIFAGWMAKDAEGLARGEQKVDYFLASNPTHSSALAWKFAAVYYHLREAQAKGNKTEYNKRIAEGKELREKAIAANPKDVAVYIIVGGMMVMGAYYAAAEDKEWMYRDGRDLLRKVQPLQGAAFDNLPPHMRGEMWSMLAYASDRLGDKEDRAATVNLMLTKLQGSPYEARAKRWQALPALTSEIDNMCISCHEPGRLKNVQSRLSAATK